MKIHNIEIDTFTEAYIDCALWSTMDESDPNTGGNPLDDNYSITDIHVDTLRRMVKDCQQFQKSHEGMYANAELAGHDFWLTRNGHGTGFWDRPEEYDKEASRVLTEDSHSYGEFNLYVGDDGVIHGD